MKKQHGEHLNQTQGLVAVEPDHGYQGRVILTAIALRGPVELLRRRGPAPVPGTGR